MPRKKQPSSSPETLETQGAKLLDVLTLRVRQWAAGEEKLSEEDIRRFAVEKKISNTDLANMYNLICDERLYPFAALFYAWMKKIVPDNAMRIALDSVAEGRAHHLGVPVIIQNMRERHPRYDYIELSDDPFRPKPPTAPPGTFGFD